MRGKEQIVSAFRGLQSWQRPEANDLREVYYFVTEPLYSVVCKGIRKMTTYHTQGGGR